MSVLTSEFRIPNLPQGPIVDEEGNATDVFLTFMQTLVSSLQLNLGYQGVVIPSQSQANVTIIQNNTMQTPVGNISTCQFGTMIYIPSTTEYPTPPDDKLVVAFNDGTVNQAPVFKTITVT